MNKRMTEFTLLAVALFFIATSGCEKPQSHCYNGKQDKDETGVDCGGSCEECPESGVDVYLAGYHEHQFFYKAMYWKNGVPVVLPDASSHSEAYSVFVQGNDVYVAGISVPSYSVAKYWKNGVGVELTDNMRHARANDIFVTGNNIYVAGRDVAYGAVYWKNGLRIDLTLGNATASANAIEVVNNDVYVAGYESNGTCWVAKYWKNGVATELTDGTKYAEAKSICVYGSDVYVSGHEDSKPVYWKNGIQYNLPGAPKGGVARDITLLGNEVNIVGSINHGTALKAMHWKNSVAYDLAPDSGVYEANSIKILDGDVYVGGFAYVHSDSTPKPGGVAYWKNGKLHQVTTDSVGNSMCFSIFVAKK